MNTTPGPSSTSGAADSSGPQDTNDRSIVPTQPDTALESSNTPNQYPAFGNRDESAAGRTQTSDFQSLSTDNQARSSAATNSFADSTADYTAPSDADNFTESSAAAMTATGFAGGATAAVGPAFDAKNFSREPRTSRSAIAEDVVPASSAEDGNIAPDFKGLLMSDPAPTQNTYDFASTTSSQLAPSDLENLSSSTQFPTEAAGASAPEASIAAPSEFENTSRGAEDFGATSYRNAAQTTSRIFPSDMDSISRRVEGPTSTSYATDLATNSKNISNEAKGPTSSSFASNTKTSGRTSPPNFENASSGAEIPSQATDFASSAPADSATLDAENTWLSTQTPAATTGPKEITTSTGTATEDTMRSSGYQGSSGYQSSSAYESSSGFQGSSGFRGSTSLKGTTTQTTTVDDDDWMPNEGKSSTAGQLGFVKPLPATFLGQGADYGATNMESVPGIDETSASTVPDAPTSTRATRGVPPSGTTYSSYNASSTGPASRSAGRADARGLQGIDESDATTSYMSTLLPSAPTAQDTRLSNDRTTSTASITAIRGGNEGSRSPPIANQSANAGATGESAGTRAVATSAGQKSTTHGPGPTHTTSLTPGIEEDGVGHPSSRGASGTSRESGSYPAAEQSGTNDGLKNSSGQSGPTPSTAGSASNDAGVPGKNVPSPIGARSSSNTQSGGRGQAGTADAKNSPTSTATPTTASTTTNPTTASPVTPTSPEQKTASRVEEKVHNRTGSNASADGGKKKGFMSKLKAKLEGHGEFCASSSRDWMLTKRIRLIGGWLV